MGQGGGVAGWSKSRVRVVLYERVGLEEMQTAASELGVGYEGLERTSLARKLVAEMEGRQRLDELAAWLMRQQPDVEAAELRAVEGAQRPEDMTVEALMSRARRLQIQGELGEALELLNAVRARAPGFAGLGAMIREVEAELREPSVSRGGRVAPEPAMDGGGREGVGRERRGRAPMRGLVVVAIVLFVVILVLVYLLVRLSMG